MKLPQLSVRDLFWLVLVAGIAVGWWVNRGQWVREVGRQKDKIDELQETAWDMWSLGHNEADTWWEDHASFFITGNARKYIDEQLRMRSWNIPDQLMFSEESATPSEHYRAKSINDDSARASATPEAR